MIKLEQILDRSTDSIQALCESKDTRYRVYPIKSKPRWRWIEAPDHALKSVQRRLLEKLLYVLPPTPYAHGFVPGRSILSHAEPHCRKPYVVVTDIVNFFPSIGIDRVREVCGALELSGEDLETVARLLTRNGRLPQGSPASPHIANLVLNRLDIDVAEALEPHGWTYSRYADDLAFSGLSDPHGRLETVRGLVAEHGFKTSSRKSRIMGRHKRQYVTGLVVNDKLSVPREQRRSLRATMHRLALDGWDRVQPADPTKVMGKLAFQSYISDYSNVPEINFFGGAQTW